MGKREVWKRAWGIKRTDYSDRNKTRRAAATALCHAVCIWDGLEILFHLEEDVYPQLIEKREGKEKRSSHKGNGADLRKGKVL